MNGKFSIVEQSRDEEKPLWEKYNLSCEYPSYFQSWDWGSVEQKTNVNVNRYCVYEGKRIIALIQLFDIKAKRGHFLHIRQGPVLQIWSNDVFTFITNFFMEEAVKRKASYIRISPLVQENDLSKISMLKSLGYREAPIHNVDAENRWVLSLGRKTSDLLQEMRKTTRYMIRKGETMGIKVIKSGSVKDIPKFLQLYDQTAKLKNFIPHSLIREEFEQFSNNDRAFIYLAELQNKVLAGAVIIYYGNEAIYRHGATSIEGRNTPASYLLQWEAIKHAQEMGLTKYNFWGIAKSDNPKNPWYGLSQFKKGFGGSRVDFLHSMDLPLKRTYWISFLIDYYTKIKKGYNH